MGDVKRAHALLSASSAHRWVHCTPSARLEEQFPDAGSDAAAEGTVAHALAEIKVRQYFYPQEVSRQKMARAVNKLKKDGHWADEMQGYTDEYLDYVKSAAMAFVHVPHADVEKTVYFDKYVPEGFGTADCILIGGDTLHVIDFKYGKGVPVSAEENLQMILYALGAYEACRIFYSIGTVKLSIVQPRIDNISEWEIPLSVLVAYGEMISDKAALAYKGEGAFAPSEENCRFCRARAQCRARAEENVRLAFFTDKKPPLITNEEVRDYLEKGEDVAKWLKDLKEYALKECLAGKEVPGWKAVEGRGSREWTDMDKAFADLTEHGIDEAILWERTPLTLAQVEKTVGKKEFQTLVGKYVVKNPGKPALAKESDKRPAVTNKVSAAEAFGGPEEGKEKNPDE